MNSDRESAGGGTDPDVMLMLALQRGDNTAFDALFRKHVRAVVGFATNLIGNRARAEELAQDVFLQVFRRRHDYEPRARFRTWLYRIVTNACLSERRRAVHTRAWVSVEQSAEDGGEGRVPELRARSSEEDAGSRQALTLLRTELALLPPQQRAALLLARGEGFSYDEVAESLSCSVPAVKSLIHRATLTLRNRFGREGIS